MENQKKIHVTSLVVMTHLSSFAPRSGICSFSDGKTWSWFVNSDSGSISFCENPAIPLERHFSQPGNLISPPEHVAALRDALKEHMAQRGRSLVDKGQGMSERERDKPQIDIRPRPMSNRPRVEIYVAGVCKDRSGPGGWGAVLNFQSGRDRSFNGFERQVSRNRIELLSVQRAFEALDYSSCVTVHTKSSYVYDAATMWIPAWRDNGWLATSKTQVKNADLWSLIDMLCTFHEVNWVLIPGDKDKAQMAQAWHLAKEGLKAALSRP